MQAHCIVCNELRWKHEFDNRKSGLKCPGCVGIPHKPDYVDMKLLSPCTCVVCGRHGNTNDFYKRESGPKCRHCVGKPSKK